MPALFDQRRYLIPFRSSLLPQIFTDTLVVGGGVAGLRAAIAAAEHGEVILVSKSDFESTNTAWAQGGIAGLLEPCPGDSPDSHFQDTLDAGAGLCDEPIVRRVVDDAPHRLRELASWGMAFDRQPSGRLALAREGGHSFNRILHAHGDATGLELERCLLDRARALGPIRIFERCYTLDLITPSAEPGALVLGAITHHARHGLQMIWARSTILAAGGAGMLFRETSNPRAATGDGIAMAYRAGAPVADMAFMQFHPTTLYVPGAQRHLISEAVRGEGAHLLDDSGRRFMVEQHPLAELAPRDVVSQAIVRQIAAQGGRHVWLDARHIPDFHRRFPSIHAQLRRFEIDPARDLIPVHPAAHYFIGGVRVDELGRTGVPGLFAVGEAACSGLHGANRLASNSLLEGLVLGAIVGDEAGRPNKPRPGPIAINSDIPPSDHGELDLSDVQSSVRSAMWRNVGIERAGPRLRDAIDMLEFWGRYTLDKVFDEPLGWETQNLLLVGWLVARSAAWRLESRGCHALAEHPAPNPTLRVHDAWKRGDPRPAIIPVALAKPDADHARI